MIFDENQWKWWTDTLEYVRTVPGKVYEDHLYKLSNDNYKKYNNADIPVQEKQIVAYLNDNTPTGNNKYFLKEDVVTGGIYTIPSHRMELDMILKEANPEYKYNKYLYIKKFDACENISCITFSDLKKNPEIFNKVFCLDQDNMELTINLTALYLHNIYAFNSFNLNEIAKDFLDDPKLTPEQKGNFHFGELKASGMIFLGETQFCSELDIKNSPPLTKGANFSEATFCGAFYAKNLTFNFDTLRDNIWDNYDSNKVDFRNVRFFDKVSFRDIRFLGDTLDMEITFEDSRIQNEIEFINFDFGRAKANFFQMIVGDYVDYIEKRTEIPSTPHKIRFINTNIDEDSVIDFSDSEMDYTELIFENIPILPQTKICPAPVRIYRENNVCEPLCPKNYLLIRNCEIQKTLCIGNVSELSFLDSNNYSKIVEAQNWGVFPKDKCYRTRTRGLGGTNISDPILFAVYNNQHTEYFENSASKLNYSKANDFIMLKENFCSAGKYDDEDEAFILYMEFKPFINSARKRKRNKKQKYSDKDPWTNILYKLLYATGKYGISPGRVVIALAVMIFIFSLIYFMFSCTLGTYSFSIGGTMGSIWDYANSECFNQVFSYPWYEKLFISFLYSLEGVIPFVSQFEPVNTWVCIVTAVENAVGSFLVGYFSVAVVRKTLR